MISTDCGLILMKEEWRNSSEKSAIETAYLTSTLNAVRTEEESPSEGETGYFGKLPDGGYLIFIQGSLQICRQDENPAALTSGCLDETEDPSHGETGPLSHLLSVHRAGSVPRSSIDSCLMYSSWLSLQADG